MAQETAKLVEHLVDLSYGDLSIATVDMAKACLLDYFGSAIAGARADSGRIATGMIRSLGSTGAATVIGGGIEADPVYASLANGISGHALEIDDYFMMHYANRMTVAGHLGSAVIPPALALGQRLSKSPRDVLVAVVAGFEVAARVSLAVGPGHYWRGFHSTGTIGTFGAIAAAIKMMDLSGNQALSAVGLAATQAAGLHGANKSYAKALHAGRAAQNGVQAALLAADGFKGVHDIIECRQGFAEVMSDGFSPDNLTEEWGHHYLIHNNSFKVYFTACFDVADGLMQIIQETDLIPEEVEKVEIFTTRDFARNQRGMDIKSVNHAKISAEFCAAVCILDRACGLEQYTPERIQMKDEKVNGLMKRVVVEPDEKINELVNHGNYSCRIRVTRKGKSAVEKFFENTIGFYRNPISFDRVQQKFRHIAGQHVDKDNVQNIINYVVNMDKEESLKPLQSYLQQ